MRAALQMAWLALFAAVVVHGAGLIDAGASIGAELLSNGDFMTATKDPTWPDDWKRKPGMSWENEKGMRFLRFSETDPGKSIGLLRAISITQNIKALTVTVRYRTRHLNVGGKKGASAQVSFAFFDAVRIKFTPVPEPIAFSDKASDWTMATATFKVPDDAVNLEIGFGLNEVEAGTLDLAQISVRNASEADAQKWAHVGANQDLDSPSGLVPIRREGTRTIIGYGNPRVWFIHPYVDVLGHDFDEGITHLVNEARDQGQPIAVGVANNLDEINQKDEAQTIYVFSYKNINFPLPADARRLIFLNTWLTPAVEWPFSRKGKKDLVLLGSRTLHNDGDGLATNKDRWFQIQEDDPTLILTVLDSTGYYFPMSVWRPAVLKIILEEQVEHK